MIKAWGRDQENEEEENIVIDGDPSIYDCFESSKQDFPIVDTKRNGGGFKW